MCVDIVYALCVVVRGFSGDGRDARHDQVRAVVRVEAAVQVVACAVVGSKEPYQAFLCIEGRDGMEHARRDGIVAASTGVSGIRVRVAIFVRVLAQGGRAVYAVEGSALAVAGAREAMERAGDQAVAGGDLTIAGVALAAQEGGGLIEVYTASAVPVGHAFVLLVSSADEPGARSAQAGAQAS